MRQREYRVEPCSGLAIEVKANERVTVVDLEGGQVVDFFAESLDNPNEFLSTGVTIDCNESLNLVAGNTVYTNLYRPMFTLLHDDVGCHDLLHPCCRPEMYDFFYHNGAGHPNCLDNINACLGVRRPIIHPLNLFMNTRVHPDGSLRVEAPLSRPGDRAVLRAEMDVRLGIAACSVSESACNSGRCTSIQILVEA